MDQTQASKKTRLALFLSGLLSEPLVGFIAILPFILRKDLHATGFQIALFNMVKPVVALLSFYWGASLWRQQEKLRSNWMGASLLARLPFLLFPFVSDVGFFILGAAVFHFFQKGGMPAQMEILKRNVPQGIRETVFSWSSALNCLLGAAIGLSLATWTDSNMDNWKMLFFWGGFVALLSLILQARVPVETSDFSSEKKPNPFLTPWKDSWNLLKQRKDFARFQVGFMLGGIGLMLIMPALTLYAADDLLITHSDVLLSRLVWMGVGFFIATPFWRKNMSYEGIFRFTAIANFLFALATLAWICASYDTIFYYIAFFLYGVAQAGSHLSWNLSGPLFAGKQESSLFSTVNILTVGLRGLIVPLTSTLLCSALGTIPVLWIGFAFCFLGFAYLATSKRAHLIDVIKQ
ncbi:MAG: MFS transporter [Rhabdochlamydiaceae bacterium]|nr:MFS transporter [Rhabdochlamydiaceae bacterium]